MGGVSELRDAIRATDRQTLERILRVAVDSDQAPLGKTVLRALRMLFTDANLRSMVTGKPDEKISAAIKAIGDVEVVSSRHAAEMDVSRFAACADLILERLK